MNWEDMDFGSKLFAVLTLLSLVVIIACGLLADAPTDNLTQREITLGDGTKATCVIVRDAGVTCVPHIVLGPDAEEDKP